MDVRKMRNELLGKRLVAALESRNMEAYYVETKEEAVSSIFNLRLQEVKKVIHCVWRRLEVIPAFFCWCQ